MISAPKTADADVREIVTALERFECRHPDSESFIYRYNPGSIRIKIVDAVFAQKSKDERHDYALKFLVDISSDARSQISVLLCLAPGESSLLDAEFEDPSRSLL